MKIKTNKFEMNKSSDLCQVVYFKKSKKDSELFNISNIQLDLLNILFYQANKFLQQNKTVDLNDGHTTKIELELSEFSTMLSKYKNYEYNKLVDYLDDLSDVRVIINALNKNKNIQKLTITRFILNIELSRHLKNNKKKIRILMDNAVLQRVHNIKSFFTKMYLAIQLSFTSKYSKLLYELLKDYANIQNITIEYNYILDLLNVVEENMKPWSKCRPHIIEKAINEINQKSDIHISYEPIKEKLEGQRKQVTKIKFNIRKQNDKQLKKLGLIEEPITSLPFYNKSKSKLDKLVKNGYKVVDEEMWIETDIRKNEKRYDAEVRIDKWLKETDKDERNDLYKILAELLDECEDPMVIIEDYTIKGLFSKDNFTKNPLETIEKLNEIIGIMNEQ